MNLSHAKAQRHKVIKNKKGHFAISYSNSATPTLIADDETGILGFAGIADDGHVTAVYVRSDRIRQGIGSSLMQEIFKYAHLYEIKRLYAEASEFSLGLFQKFGFHIYDFEIVDRHGVKFKRYLVERE